MVNIIFDFNNGIGQVFNFRDFVFPSKSKFFMSVEIVDL